MRIETDQVEGITILRVRDTIPRTEDGRTKFHEAVANAIGDLTEPTVLYIKEPGSLRPTDVAELLGTVLHAYQKSDRQGIQAPAGQFVLVSPREKRRFPFDALSPPPGAPAILHFAESEAAAIRFLLNG